MNDDSKELKIDLNLDGLSEVKKQYKKIKKYMRSPLYTVRVMDGKEKVVSKLLKGLEDNPN